MTSRPSTRCSMTTGPVLFSFPVLLSLLRWLVPLLLISSVFCYDDDKRETKFSFVKNAEWQSEWAKIGCKGSYNYTYYDRVESVCDYCFTLFRKDVLLRLCKQSCFTSAYFKGCLEVQLLATDSDLNMYNETIQYLHGAAPKWTELE